MSASQAESRGFESLHPLQVAPGFLQTAENIASIERLLQAMLDGEARRRLALWSKSNRELFDLYRDDLKLRVQDERNLNIECQFLGKFEAFLGEDPPSALLAKSFLARFKHLKPSSLHKYASRIKTFMKWCGEELDFSVKVPHTMPEYVRDEDLFRLMDGVRQKKTHRKSIERDLLLIYLAYRSGLRRAELANLHVRDIQLGGKYLIVRGGKGGKDRPLPLPGDIVEMLATYLSGKGQDEKLFDIKPASLGDWITRQAKRAGVPIHTHSLRHGYATRLLESGANLKELQELLGHARLSTTEVYLSLTPHHLREAVNRLSPMPQPPASDPTSRRGPNTPRGGENHRLH